MKAFNLIYFTHEFFYELDKKNSNFEKFEDFKNQSAFSTIFIQLKNILYFVSISQTV